MLKINLNAFKIFTSSHSDSNINYELKARLNKTQKQTEILQANSALKQL